MTKKQDNSDIEHFNRRAATYETDSSQEHFFDNVQRYVLKLMQQKNPNVVLDVGCGTGRLLRKAKQQWPKAHLIGVDAAEKMIQQATQLFPEAEFHVAMAEDLPVADNSVDLAFSTLSFHHWANQTKGISEVARVLESQGSFFLADITVPAWMTFFVKRFKHSSSAKIREMFEAAGLTVELQERSARWFRVLLITAGSKH